MKNEAGKDKKYSMFVVKIKLFNWTINLPTSLYLTPPLLLADLSELIVFLKLFLLFLSHNQPECQPKIQRCFQNI